jgi:hypothetical protein
MSTLLLPHCVSVTLRCHRVRTLRARLLLACPDSSHPYQYCHWRFISAFTLFPVGSPASRVLCCWIGFAVARRQDTNPVDPPSLLFILSSPPRPTSLLGLRGGPLPRLPVASPYSCHARDLWTIPQSDHIRHSAPYQLQMGTSFGARALPTAGASVNLVASPFVLSRTRVDADGDHQNHKPTIR